MKLTLILLALVTSTSSFAKISNSSYESRHLNMIEKAITNECGLFYKLTQIESSEEIIQVDQGIRDVIYSTKIEAIDRIDQGVFDEYEVKVVSEYADMYDHSNQDWGVFSVTSVTCQML